MSSRLEAMRLYREARHLDNRNVDATVGLGDMLKQDLRPEDAIREMAKVCTYVVFYNDDNNDNDIM